MNEKCQRWFNTTFLMLRGVLPWLAPSIVVIERNHMAHPCGIAKRYSQVQVKLPYFRSWGKIKKTYWVTSGFRYREVTTNITKKLAIFLLIACLSPIEVTNKLRLGPSGGLQT